MRPSFGRSVRRLGAALWIVPFVASAVMVPSAAGAVAPSGAYSADLSVWHQAPANFNPLTASDAQLRTTRIRSAQRNHRPSPTGPRP